MLYELLTGKRAFGGKTVTDTLAKVLEGEPDWNAVPEDTPSRIKELMADCLEKDTADRLRDIGHVRIQIKKTLRKPVAAPLSGQTLAARPGQWGRAVTLGLVALAGAVIGVALWTLTSSDPPTGQSLRKFVITPTASAALVSTGGNDLAISPDGRQVIYRGSQSQLYLRSLDGLVDKPIPGTEGSSGTPSFPRRRGL